MPRATFALETPAVATGAVAAVALRGDLDAVFQALRVKPVQIGEARVRRVPGVDDLLVARWSASCAHLFPHAGPAAMAALFDSLCAAGATPETNGPADAMAAWPEAQDLTEALMLGALAAAPSPLAAALLLQQPDRWARWRETRRGARPTLEEIDAHSAALNRLLAPPVVAAIGATNIGKSSLLNALAGREAALVADEPGSTRDYVGATLDMDGLVVTWLDCPGRRAAADELEAEAIARAEAAAAVAALVVACADGATDWPLAPQGVPALRVSTRADLGRREGADIETSAALGQGLDTLARAVRALLVPEASLSFGGPWRFHPSLPLSAGIA